MCSQLAAKDGDAGKQMKQQPGCPLTAAQVVAMMQVDAECFKVTWNCLLQALQHTHHADELTGQLDSSVSGLAGERPGYGVLPLQRGCPCAPTQPMCPHVFKSTHK